MLDCVCCRTASVLRARVLLQRLTTMSIAPGRILSEAFQDERAAWLFHAPSAEGDPVLFFALPVGIVKDATELLKELGCTATDGFSGTLIWRIDAQATQGTDGIVSVSASIQRVAAVPSTCASCCNVLCSYVVLMKSCCCSVASLAIMRLREVLGGRLRLARPWHQWVIPRDMSMSNSLCCCVRVWRGTLTALRCSHLCKHTSQLHACSSWTTLLWCCRGACGTPAGCSTACRHEQSMVKRIRLVGEDDELQFMTVSNCHTVSVPWASIAAATPETTLPTAGTTEPAVGAASEGNFTVIQGTSQQFSGREGQCGVAAV